MVPAKEAIADQLGTQALVTLPRHATHEIIWIMQKTPKDVAAAIIIERGRVLVTRRAPGQKLAGLWEFPGGKIEAGETAQTCIIRELAEELAITCEAGEVLTSNIHSYPGGAINLIAVQASMTCESWQLTVHDRAEWVAADELMALELAPADIPIARWICEAFLPAEPGVG